jgi:hypothetical protein
MPTVAEYWIERTTQALDGYTETLRRLVVATLLKPRTPIPVEEITSRILNTLTNAPVIDRRLRELPPASRWLLTVMGRTRQPHWKVGHILGILASLGSTEGLDPIRSLFDCGLLYPDRPANAGELPGFEPWLAASGILEAKLFALPAVAARARGEDLPFPELPAAETELGATPRIADGLEWPLRLAVVEQLVGGTPFRTTQSNALFKRDLQRIEGNEILSQTPSDHVAPIRDGGVLALYWAAAVGRPVLEGPGHSVAPREHPAALMDTLGELAAALPSIEVWDPLRGYTVPEAMGLAPFPSAGVLSLLMLASAPAGRWVAPSDIAEWLWAHHPSWSGALESEAQKSHGAGWVEAFLLGPCYSLRLVEALPNSEGPAAVRLSDLGAHLLAGGPKPPEPPGFPQSVLVQPNAELLAYRQGLNPSLIGKLSRFAKWKALGPACTLELTAEQTYAGLESGLTLAGIIQTLNQHGSRPVPPPVVDLLQRWANKRDRISVYASATLVEFQSPADLDAAISRGIVAARVTDRIGLCSDGADPDYKALRLIGNRDYESKPSRCIAVADDGVTLTVDAGQSDLLLEAEIGRLSEPVHGDPAGVRRFRITPESLRKAASHGWRFAEIDEWFVNRTGAGLPAAGCLFLNGTQLPPPQARKRLVVQVAEEAIADGLMQWPETRGLIEDRLGPAAVVVDEPNLPRFAEILAALGIPLERHGV